MNRNVIFASLCILVAASAPAARAQAPYPPMISPYARPPVMGLYGPYGPYTPGLSPYLNLIRPGSPAINYFSGVLPQREQRQFQQQFGQTLLDLEQRAAAPAEAEELLPTLPSTGHATQFNYTGSYFPTLGYGARPGTIGLGAPQPRLR